MSASKTSRRKRKIRNVRKRRAASVEPSGSVADNEHPDWGERLVADFHSSSLRDDMRAYIERNMACLDKDWASTLVRFLERDFDSRPDAEQIYARLRAVAPPCAVVEHGMGEWYQEEEGLFHRARRHYLLAVELSPQVAPYRVALGLNSYLVGAWGPMQEAYGGVPAIARDDEQEFAARAHFNLGAYHQNHGDGERALRCFKGALEVWPEYPAAREALRRLQLGAVPRRQP